VKRPCLYPLFFGGEAKGEFWAGLFACAFALAKDEFLLLFLGLLFCLCLEALLLRYPRLLLRATQDPGEERERVGGREAGRVCVRACVCVRVCACVGEREREREREERERERESERERERERERGERERENIRRPARAARMCLCAYVRA
jgi:hypothetical protein